VNQINAEFVLTYVYIYIYIYIRISTFIQFKASKKKYIYIYIRSVRDPSIGLTKRRRCYVTRNKGPPCGINSFCKC